MWPAAPGLIPQWEIGSISNFNCKNSEPSFRIILSLK